MFTLNSTEVHAVCYGLDLYNQTLTGGVSMTVTAKNSDCHHVPCVLIYDARGNGGGAVSPTIAGDHEDRITDYTAIVVHMPYHASVDTQKGLEHSAQAVET
jgi:hypothetical protein